MSLPSLTARLNISLCVPPLQLRLLLLISIGPGRGLEPGGLPGEWNLGACDCWGLQDRLPRAPSATLIRMPGWPLAATPGCPQVANEGGGRGVGWGVRLVRCFQDGGMEGG